MATRIISIVGRKDTGKTTLVVALTAELRRQKRRVMTIKHASHPAEFDRPGTDSWRHFHEGGAERVVLASPDARFIEERSPDTLDPVALARRYLDGADIVLVEGFKAARLPKIEVFRRAVAQTPLYDPAAAESEDWVAILTDTPSLDARCRVLRFTDTMWMQQLAALAWDRAKVIPA
ncbi:MAG TPA: molybdopterin-guanine dinucleotide biosynthesis protein B [Gemmatimonadales bacterium]|nr:molybdopterin-guanine dinucleotide biosynthesis protein B [Gemmatimonadales bacterium]